MCMCGNWNTSNKHNSICMNIWHYQKSQKIFHLYCTQKKLATQKWVNTKRNKGEKNKKKGDYENEKIIIILVWRKEQMEEL